ncbi:MAG TPA: relaxase/mobilization nuclease domain-containing protein, partial [Candidatus Cybelea sp.]|nr:relaxase/mobilization nuclease domain-containing protein [Candidatus Cybelea sp.]
MPDRGFVDFGAVVGVITKSVPARAHTRTFAVGVDYITEHTHQRAVTAAGATFEGGVTYASAPEKAAWVHLRGVTSVETAAIEMEAVAVLSARCHDPVYHLIIAYAKHERPTREQVVTDAERLLKAIGMDDHQYVLAAHKDTDDFHAHVIANRVGPDGRANDLWRERIVRERVGAEIAAERGWDIVAGRHNRDIVQRIERLHDLPAEPERRLSDGAYRRLHERG